MLSMPYNPAELHDLIILIAYCRIYAQDDDDRSASFDKCFIIDALLSFSVDFSVDFAVDFAVISILIFSGQLVFWELV